MTYEEVIAIYDETLAKYRNCHYRKRYALMAVAEAAVKEYRLGLAPQKIVSESQPLLDYAGHTIAASIHQAKNESCPHNDSETATSQVISGLPCTCT